MQIEETACIWYYNGLGFISRVKGISNNSSIYQ